MKFIVLTQGKKSIVDDEDFILLSRKKWHAVNFHEKYYAETTIDGKNMTMHRLLTNPPKGMIVDHINGDSLDNRKINLRICSHKQNLCNSNLSKRNKVGFKGVVKRSKGCYSAQITSERKSIHIGCFDSAKDAAIAYDKEANLRHGEYARTNLSLGLLS